LGFLSLNTDGEAKCSRVQMKRLFPQVLFFRAFLLADWVVKFDLQFLLVVYFATIEFVAKISPLNQPIATLKHNTYVKSRFICTRENFASASVN